MSCHTEIEFDKIDALLQQVIEGCEALYFVLKDGSEEKVVMGPDGMAKAIQQIVALSNEIADQLHMVESGFSDPSLLYYCEDIRASLHMQIASFMENRSSMTEFWHQFLKAYEYEEYLRSSSSGNPGNFKGVAWSQVRFCRLFPEFLNACWQLKWGLEELKLTDGQSTMAAVYASPEMMKGKVSSTAISGTYPDIHAVRTQASSEKEDEFEDTMMEELYGSPEMIREYESERTGLQDNQTVQNNKEKRCICGKLVSAGEERCPHCGRSMVDPEETGWFCKKCGKWVPMKERVCPYCGNDMFS